MKAPDARMTRAAVLSGAATAAVATLLAPTEVSATNFCCNLIGLDYKAGGGAAPGATSCALPHTGAKKLNNIQLVGVKCGETPQGPAGYTLKYVIPYAGIMGKDEENANHGSATAADGHKNMIQNVFVYIKK
jgi:hypothetical protein